MNHPIDPAASTASHLDIAGERRLTAAEFQILAEVRSGRMVRQSRQPAHPARPAALSSDRRRMWMMIIEPTKSF